MFTHISVGWYQYFASGIRYYKFKGIRYFTVFWSSTDTQITSYNWHFCYIKLTLKLVHKIPVTTLMITWQVKIDVIFLFTCSIVIEHKFAAGQL